MTTPAPTFIHVPKTAGSTMRGLMQRRFPDLYKLYDRTAELPPEAYTASAFCGHMPWGLHERLGRDLAYFTVLRDPVQRIVSSYYYLKRRPQHPQHHVTDVPLEEFQNDRNSVCRLLAGYGNAQELPDDMDDQRLFELALEHCDAMVAVGMQHRFDESVALVAKRLGWGVPRYHSVNRAPSYPHPPEATIQRFRADNALDQELYEKMAARFDREAREIKRFTLLVKANNRAFDAARRVRAVAR